MEPPALSAFVREWPQDALEPVLFVGASAWRPERRDMDVDRARPHASIAYASKRIRAGVSRLLDFDACVKLLGLLWATVASGHGSWLPPRSQPSCWSRCNI